MKADVGVFEEPSEGCGPKPDIRCRCLVGKFILRGGLNLSEAAGRILQPCRR